MLSVLICSLICLFVCTFGISSNIVSSFFSLLTSPLQKVATDTFISASQIIKSDRSAESYESEIENLKQELQKLRLKIIKYNELEIQNKKYSEYLNLKASNESLQFVSATVIGRSPLDDFYGFTINKGYTAGISVNDSVITSNGLIGRITSVDAMSSKVQTILSPDTKIGAIDQETLDSGILVGDAKLASQNQVRLAYISEQTLIKDGSMIVTTGLSGLYPRNLLLGKIIELKNDEYDSSRYAIVEPFEDIRNINDVMVITDFEGKGIVEKKSILELFPQKNNC